MNQKAIFLMGVSGSGKSTVQPGLLEEKKLNFSQVNTTTTRPMREGEIQGEMYDFVSDDRFVALQEADDFIEYALVHQKYHYGTRKSLVQEVFAQEQNVLKQVDINGREQIMEQDDVRQYSRSVFMDVSDETIRERIFSRDESISEDEIQRRLESAQYERLKAQEICDVVIEVDHMTMDEQFAAIRDIMIDMIQA